MFLLLAIILFPDLSHRENLPLYLPKYYLQAYAVYQGKRRRDKNRIKVIYHLIESSHKTIKILHLRDVTHVLQERKINAKLLGHTGKYIFSHLFFIGLFPSA